MKFLRLLSGIMLSSTLLKEELSQQLRTWFIPAGILLYPQVKLGRPGSEVLEGHQKVQLGLLGWLSSHHSRLHGHHINYECSQAKAMPNKHELIQCLFI